MAENRNDDWWKKSRQILARLFDGYHKDYGPEDGTKIVRTIIDVLGGCRLTVPEKMPSNPDNAEALLSLYVCFCERFGHASGGAIMRKFLLDLKCCRISFPDYDDIYRDQRNARIRVMFDGGNYKELSIRFELAVSTVWEIVNEE